MALTSEGVLPSLSLWCCFGAHLDTAVGCASELLLCVCVCVAAGASISISRPGVTLHTTVFACQPLTRLLHVFWAHFGGCLSCRAMLLPKQL